MAASTPIAQTPSLSNQASPQVIQQQRERDVAQRLYAEQERRNQEIRRQEEEVRRSEQNRAYADVSKAADNVNDTGDKLEKAANRYNDLIDRYNASPSDKERSSLRREIEQAREEYNTLSNKYEVDSGAYNIALNYAQATGAISSGDAISYRRETISSPFEGTEADLKERQKQRQDLYLRREAEKEINELVGEVNRKSASLSKSGSEYNKLIDEFNSAQTADEQKRIKGLIENKAAEYNLLSGEFESVSRRYDSAISSAKARGFIDDSAASPISYSRQTVNPLFEEVKTEQQPKQEIPKTWEDLVNSGLVRVSGTGANGKTLITADSLKQDGRAISYSNEMLMIAKNVSETGNPIEKAVANHYIWQNDKSSFGSAAFYEKTMSDLVGQNINKKVETGNGLVDALGNFGAGVINTPAQTARMLSAGAFGAVGAARGISSGRGVDVLVALGEGAVSAGKSTMEFAVDNPFAFAGSVLAGVVTSKGISSVSKIGRVGETPKVVNSIKTGADDAQSISSPLLNNIIESPNRISISPSNSKLNIVFPDEVVNSPSPKPIKYPSSEEVYVGSIPFSDTFLVKNASLRSSHSGLNIVFPDEVVNSPSPKPIKSPSSEEVYVGSIPLSDTFLVKNASLRNSHSGLNIVFPDEVVNSPSPKPINSPSSEEVYVGSIPFSDTFLVKNASLRNSHSGLNIVFPDEVVNSPSSKPIKSPSPEEVYVGSIPFSDTFLVKNAALRNSHSGLNIVFPDEVVNSPSSKPIKSPSPEEVYVGKSNSGDVSLFEPSNSKTLDSVGSSDILGNYSLPQNKSDLSFLKKSVVGSSVAFGALALDSILKPIDGESVFDFVNHKLSELNPLTQEYTLPGGITWQPQKTAAQEAEEQKKRQEDEFNSRIQFFGDSAEYFAGVSADLANRQRPGEAIALAQGISDFMKFNQGEAAADKAFVMDGAVSISDEGISFNRPSVYLAGAAALTGAAAGGLAALSGGAAALAPEGAAVLGANSIRGGGTATATANTNPVISGVGGIASETGKQNAALYIPSSEVKGGTGLFTESEVANVPLSNSPEIVSRRISGVTPELFAPKTTGLSELGSTNKLFSGSEISVNRINIDAGTPYSTGNTLIDGYPVRGDKLAQLERIGINNPYSESTGYDYGYGNGNNLLDRDDTKTVGRVGIGNLNRTRLENQDLYRNRSENETRNRNRYEYGYRYAPGFRFENVRKIKLPDIDLDLKPKGEKKKGGKKKRGKAVLVEHYLPSSKEFIGTFKTSGKKSGDLFKSRSKKRSRKDNLLF